MYVQTDSHEKSGCDLNLTSIPEESIVIDVDVLLQHHELSQVVVGQDRRCDLAVFALRNGAPTVLLIEATTTSSRPSRKLRSGLEQLSESFENLASLMQACDIQIPEVEKYGVIVSKKVGRNTTNNDAIETERRKFENAHDANVRIVKSSDDIWTEI